MKEKSQKTFVNAKRNDDAEPKVFHKKRRKKNPKRLRKSKLSESKNTTNNSRQNDQMFGHPSTSSGSNNPQRNVVIETSKTVDSISSTSSRYKFIVIDGNNVAFS